MIVLTPAERRVAVLLVALLALGAAFDRLDRRVTPPLDPAHTRVDHPRVTPTVTRVDPPGGAPPVTGVDPPGGAPLAGFAIAPPLDLNRASARELDELPGVGPVLAARIIEQRARLGGFRAIEDLRAVRGIGPRLLERIRPRVRLGAGVADSVSARGGSAHPARSR